MAYVYRHIRLDKNEPFYIGIGSDNDGKYKRAKSKSDRNNHWHNIIACTDYRVQIMFDDLTWEEACEKEIELIALYGRKDLGLGTLVNLTDGGDGMVGYVQSESTRQKIGLKHKGKIISEKQKELNSKYFKGRKKSDSQKNKMKKNSAKAKMVINLENGFIYGSAFDAFESQKQIKTYVGFKSMMNSSRPNKTNFAYVENT